MMMYDSDLPCSRTQPVRAPAEPMRAVPDYMRDASELRVSFAGAGSATRLDRHYETGSLRLRLPKAQGRCEAVLINTGGGIAGGDRLSVAMALGPASHVLATSQSAEKVYRAEDRPATIAVRLALGPSARLAWLPQETIIHDGARLSRTLDADLAPDATLTWLEIMVLGRLACGERLSQGALRDRWRIRRGGRLVLAEDVRLDGNIADKLDRPALGGGARAIATLVHIAPQAEQRLAGVRAALATATGAGGASAWNGLLVTRIAGPDPAAVRAAVALVAATVTGDALPRSWSC